MRGSVRQEVKDLVARKAVESNHFELSLIASGSEVEEPALLAKLIEVVKPVFMEASSCFVAMPRGIEVDAVISRSYVSKVRGGINLSIRSESIDSLHELWLSDEHVNTRGSIAIELNQDCHALNNFFKSCYDPTIVTNISPVIGSSLAKRTKEKVKEIEELVYIVFRPEGIKKVSVYSASTKINDYLNYCYDHSRLSLGFLNNYGNL